MRFKSPGEGSEAEQTGGSRGALSFLLTLSKSQRLLSARIFSLAEASCPRTLDTITSASFLTISDGLAMNTCPAHWRAFSCSCSSPAYPGMEAGQGDAFLS